MRFERLNDFLRTFSRLTKGLDNNFATNRKRHPAYMSSLRPTKARREGRRVLSVIIAGNRKQARSTIALSCDYRDQAELDEKNGGP